MRACLDDPVAILEKTERRWKSWNRRLGRMRFLCAPRVGRCLAMLTELEAYLGDERRLAAVVGPSLVTLRSWRRRKTMSIPSRRLVWLTWAILLHPDMVQTPNDLVVWGKWRCHGGLEECRSLKSRLFGVGAVEDWSI